MEKTLGPCPFCGGRAVDLHATRYEGGERSNKPRVAFYVRCRACGARGPMFKAKGEGFSPISERDHDRQRARAMDAWNRRAERTWHDFSDELPPVGVSVLCRGKNGALYVGKPVTFNGNVTRKVWVPRGDQYRAPEKWMEVSA